MPNEDPRDLAEQEIIRDSDRSPLQSLGKGSFLDPTFCGRPSGKNARCPLSQLHMFGVQEKIPPAFGLPAQAAGAGAEAMLNTF